ncbi:MAG: ExbD/TolR family protein [Pannonibacter sp.]
MKFRTPPRRQMTDNTIPLINIVFLMLIFFLFAGSVARDDARRITPPEMIQDDENIRSTGALIIAGESMFFLEDRPVTLEAAIAAHLAQGGGLMRVAAEATLPSDQLEAVLVALTGAGIRDVVLITRKGAAQ